MPTAYGIFQKRQHRGGWNRIMSIINVGVAVLHHIQCSWPRCRLGWDMKAWYNILKLKPQGTPFNYAWSE
ncbi:hypothetical protein CEXT_442871 [Caerostris extrusa]|uniref:Uncharacterized protein n=1 Tax=Caerostris extrusa TaxID=172846 RepID=A0AAV4Y219_CAEEX|nr:hypothetical protein CEXT_442871 [Caerostris extrusa]